MVIFMDSGDWTVFGRYDCAGYTTNPSLLKGRDATIADLVSHAQGKPISLEVTSDELGEMETQALELSKAGPNVYVKIPVTNTKGDSTASLVKKLSQEGIKLNVTAIFTHDQIRTMARSLYPYTPSILSIFAGRIADTGRDPVPFITTALNVKHSETQVLWASAREVLNVYQAQSAGADIITLSPSLLSKYLQYKGKDLKEFSLETVKQFYEDGKK